MNRFATASSALALLTALAAAPVLAQQAPTTVTTSNFNVRIGGFMDLGVGYVDSDFGEGGEGQSDGHNAEVEIINNSEVIFNFSLTADNGLTFFAKAEIENNNDGTVSDEYVGGVRGAFGTIEIGAEDGAADRLRGSPPGTAFSNVVDGTGILFDYASDQSPAVPAYNVDSSDDLKITYFTPRFSGFQAGVSYANGREGPTSTNGFAGDRESFELGANYENTFGEVSLFVGAGYYNASEPRSRTGDFDDRFVEDSFSFTANVGFAGFTVGAAYYQNNYGEGDDDEIIGAGVSYGTGPWLFGVSYGQNIGGVAEDDLGIGAGVDYALAPGVTVGAVLEYADGDRGTDQDEEAFAAGVLMGLSF